MYHAALPGGGESRGVLHGLLYDGVDLRDLLVGDDAGAGLGLHEFYLVHAVVLFYGAGELVFADAVIVVVLHAGAHHQAGLYMGAHLQAVGVEAGLILADQQPLLEHFVEILGGLPVDALVVHVGAGRQVYLRLGHVQEAVGLALGHLAGLVGVHHVVRRGYYFLRLAGRGPYAADGREKRKFCHVFVLGLKISPGPVAGTRA